MRSSGCNNVYIMEAAGSPAIRNVKPAALIYFQVERRSERLRGVINVDRGNANSNLSDIAEIDIDVSG